VLYFFIISGRAGSSTIREGLNAGIFVNLLMLFYVLYRRRKVSQVFVLRVDEDALTEAVPADPVAHITNQQKRRRRIFMLEPGHYAIGFLVRRIKPAPFVKFLKVGDDQLSDRIVRVVPIDKRQIIVAAAKSKLVGHLLELGLFGRA